MSPERMEAFSDGVFAVIITITVLDIKTPRDASLAGLVAQAPLLASYALSFTNIGIYWVNHHHMLRAVKYVNGATLWLNLHLLFWLSFIPLTTTWEGDYFGFKWPTVVYGIVLLAAGAAYVPLAKNLSNAGGAQERIAGIIGRDWRMPAALIMCAVGIGVCFLEPWLKRMACYLADGFYLAVALMWFLPNKKIEKALAEEHARAGDEGKKE